MYDIFFHIIHQYYKIIIMYTYILYVKAFESVFDNFLLHHLNLIRGYIHVDVEPMVYPRQIYFTPKIETFRSNFDSNNILRILIYGHIIKH